MALEAKKDSSVLLKAYLIKYVGIWSHIFYALFCR